ncbi:MAG: ATP-binding domain-containing protein [Thermomicrobiales bacterium]
MQQAIERIMAYTLGDQQARIGAAGVRVLADIISPTWEIQVALKAQMREERERFRTLTEQQFFVLDMLASHRRALIDGCAGSGKTFLAVEKARRLANEGFNTLLTCYNKNLAASIREGLEPMPATLRVQHFHELAYELVKQAGIPNNGLGGDSDLYFKETLPTLLLDAVDRIPDRFDAIFVDEGQDFQGEWWVPLGALLNTADDIWYVFFDSMQTTYTDGMSLPFDSDPHFLPVNLRNTQAIHRLIEPYYAGRTVSCSGPEGRQPRIFTTADPENTVRQELHRIVSDEGIAAADVVILTGMRQRRSRWQEGQKFGNLSLTWDAQPDPNQIRVATVHSFKGLERPVVIVTEMDQASGESRNDHLQLVACSRASRELLLIQQA